MNIERKSSTENSIEEEIEEQIKLSNTHSNNESNESISSEEKKQKSSTESADESNGKNTNISKKTEINLLDQKTSTKFNPSFDMKAVSSATKTIRKLNEDGTSQKLEIFRPTLVNPKLNPNLDFDVSFKNSENEKIEIKQMEKVDNIFNKEILEDITEESEKFSWEQSETRFDEQKSINDFSSIVSLNMMRILEEKVEELQKIVMNKDICIAALNMQLDASQRREIYSSELPPSGRDSSSLTTNSTEYKIIQDDTGNEIHVELVQRDNLIEKLTNSLQQSITIREGLQEKSEKLAKEVQSLRMQLNEALEGIKKTDWLRDQESNCQRISEISIDLVSESEDDLQQKISVNTDQVSCNYLERKLSEENVNSNYEEMPLSRQLDPFKQYLNSDELRIFLSLEHKFEFYLNEQLQKNKIKSDAEVKMLSDQIDEEKQERECEIIRLKQLLANVNGGSTELTMLKQELNGIHTKEMEDLRLYFEKKCADLEKQFSEEVFSQQNEQKDSLEISEDEAHSGEKPKKDCQQKKNQRKKTREELYTSPTHRQITPTTLFDNDKSNVPWNYEDSENINELKAFYNEKMQEMKDQNEKIVKKLEEKVKSYEGKYSNTDFTPDAKVKKLCLTIDENCANKDGHEINEIAAEYERRLNEQLKLAKEDIICELEQHIQALLSESTTDDNNWPPELILLREKFTAKSQLEIAQLQIKHEEEMSRLKFEFEKQLNRKIKRQSNFDSSRNLDQILNERDSLRKLSSCFRYILSELSKHVLVCANDLNTTFIDEMQQFAQQHLLEQSTSGDVDDNSILNTSNRYLQTTLSKRLLFVPDITNLLAVIEDPELLSFISNNSVSQSATTSSFDLKNCIEKLNIEANNLLKLTENFNEKANESLKYNNESYIPIEKDDSCEEGDGLKSNLNRMSSTEPNIKVRSMDESLLRDQFFESNNLQSLPTNLNNLNICEKLITSDVFLNSKSEQLDELRNRLVKAERKNSVIQQELKKNKQSVPDQLDYHQKDSCEEIRLHKNRTENYPTNFCKLQDKARNLLSNETQNTSNSSADENNLLQVIEEFFREGDKIVENGKREREDLEAQIIAADKQLRATRQFLEDQAVDRELERDEFVREIEKLKIQLRDKEKERYSLQNVSKEVEHMEHQIKKLNEEIAGFESRKDKMEIELKASIDKIFVLREIISELETQIETKSLNEHVLTEKIKEMENFESTLVLTNNDLKAKVDNWHVTSQDYEAKIKNLQEMLQNYGLPAEQSSILQELRDHLRDIALTLDQKTKALESLHQSMSSISLSTSPAEDVSLQSGQPSHKTLNVTNLNESPKHTIEFKHLPFEDLQIILQNLEKHTRIEEMTIKRIKDLEMQMEKFKRSYDELQQERDDIQERKARQKIQISQLQSNLEEQRRHLEDLQRVGTSNLNFRIHDLQNELQNLNEKLSIRDKQINHFKNQLEKSKSIIDRQESDLAMSSQNDRGVVEKLEGELKRITEENKKLKEKVKSEMINKLALPDLMETMLADKNEEIDHLKEQLETQNIKVQNILKSNTEKLHMEDQEKQGSGEANITADGENTEGKLSARTLSDIVSISEYDEPDVIRRAPLDIESLLVLPETSYPEKTMETSNLGTANLTQKRIEDLTIFHSQTIPTFDNPYFVNDTTLPTNFMSGDTFEPRQINFSEFDNNSKTKESTRNNDELRNMKLQLEEYENEIKSLQIKIQTMEETDNIEQLEIKSKQINSLLTEKEMLKSCVNALNCKILELEKYIDDLKALEEKYTTFEIDFVKMKDDLELKNDIICNLKKLLDESSKNVSEFKDVMQQKEALNIKMIERDEKLVQKDVEILNLKQIAEKHIERISQLQKKLSIDSNLHQELNLVRSELSKRAVQNEKCRLDIEVYENDLKNLRDHIKEKDKIIASFSTDSKSIQKLLVSIQQKLNDTENLCILKTKLYAELDKNLELENRNLILLEEIEKLRAQNSDISKPFSIDEIAEQVEKELNYSAQLDSNILKAFESEENLNIDIQTKTDTEKLQNQLQKVKEELQAEQLKVHALQNMLHEEKFQSQEIQQQDVAILDAIRLRLEEAMAKEQHLNQLIDEEREKCERLNTHIALLQRSEARKSSLLLRSPPDSPRKFSKSLDAENDVVDCMKSEIKLLNAQIEREKERASDLQRVLDREKTRFDTEINERLKYCEKLKYDMEKLSKEKETINNENEYLQEQVVSQSQEITDLERRIGTLQVAETKRVQRRDRERTETTQNFIELEEIKSKLKGLEIERDNLNQTILLLRGDIDRGAQREIRLTEALSNSNSNSILPNHFMIKIKEMNSLLSENTKENHQMRETVHTLIGERKSLQKKCNELEGKLSSISTANISDLEDRANHLLRRYLKVESHRKALVHQKRYLVISLQSYKNSENKALTLLNSEFIPQRRRNLFKSAALVVIAIERMKFIVKRWHTGRKIVTKTIFTLTQQRLPINSIPSSTSPPCRDIQLTQQR